MLSECQQNGDYAKAAIARGKSSYSAAESLFMTLIFQQQKRISHLIEKISIIY
jgi:hypothetical protein